MLTQENGKELPGRVSAANADPWHSHDHGCLQVNDHWHFGTKGWTNFDDIYDPSFNVQYALKIFKGRGNWGGWYSVCTVDHQPKFPGYWCK
jgi:hypothetical protein